MEGRGRKKLKSMSLSSVISRLLIVHAQPGEETRVQFFSSSCRVPIPGCYNNNNEEDSHRVSFHSFPSDKARNRLWIARVGRGPTWRPNHATCICRRDFIDGGKTAKHSHPTIFPFRDEERYNHKLVVSHSSNMLAGATGTALTIA